MRNRNDGMTLLELIAALAIVSILTLISVSTYTTYVKKGRRIDAINDVLSISLAEEKYRMNNNTYGTLAQVWGGVTASPEGYYTVAISNVSGTAYTITATTQGSQVGDSENGTSCNTLTLSFSSGVITKSPSICWPK